MTAPDRGQLLRAVGFLGIAVLALNSTIGGGIFGLPPNVVERAGLTSPWLFLVVGLLIIPIVLTFAQLGIHDKAVSVLNVCGYYDKLLAFFDQAVEEGFVRQRTRSLLLSDADVEALLDKLAAYKHDRAGALLPAASWRATPKEAKTLAR